MRRILLWTMATMMLLALPATGFSSAAFAAKDDTAKSERGEGKRGRRGGKGRWHRMAQRLNLTEEQAKQIREIRQERRDDIKSKREAMKAARDSLQTAMSGNSSESQLRGLHDSVLNSRQAFAKARFDQVLAIRAILTPEQRKQFAEMENRGGRGHRGGKGRRFRGGDEDGD